ncbi:uncharacterized protein RCC_03380 [Ramularia collo-cygni]|uniref:RNB domain-containing protein n=1 Tax=Ramularia collo-cygni TaxID=112498 RepID=A0A2D3V1Z8_9PEZI|nr:uncharacterized protein RCC_03380 [Ramularia collo-cygni]CZT17546.1 uncharacterized protein RCC_03380 [Ramularia collo-cygni]
MLASRCGYMCRSCRARTQSVLQYEQRRGLNDGRRPPVGNRVLAQEAEVRQHKGKTARKRRQRKKASYRGQDTLVKYDFKPDLRHHVSPDRPEKFHFTENERSTNPVGRIPHEAPSVESAEAAAEGVDVKHDAVVRYEPVGRIPHEAPGAESAEAAAGGVDIKHDAVVRYVTQYRQSAEPVGRIPHEAPGAESAEAAAGGVDVSHDGFANMLDDMVELAGAEVKIKTRESAIEPRTTPQGTPSNPLLFTPSKTMPRQQPSAVPTFAWQKTSMSTLIPDARQFNGLCARMLHTSQLRHQHAEAAASETKSAFDSLRLATNLPPAGGIRAHLRKWQELHGNEDDPIPAIPQDDVALGDAPYNDFQRLPDEACMRLQAQQDENEMEQEIASGFVAATGKEGYDRGNAVEDARFLSPGDLVEIDFTRSERESILAVFIRPVGLIGNYAQFLTMQGKWLHQSERLVQYHLKGFADTATLNAIIPHLPNPESMADLQALADKAYTEDLSVPREVSAPLIAKMVKFYDDSQEIYRLHANALDDAHRILAHDTDLWYGTLTTAATTLLKMPAASLPKAALFAVRRALVHAGFAFNMDRRSHRQTGYFQIRSKAQVKNVEQVRHWVRQWQDDLAKTAAMSEQAKKYHSPSKGASYVYSFVEKAKVIAMKSRETRQPTECHNIGISKTRIPLTNDTDCVKITTGNEFTEEEQEILRFMESWACTSLFVGLNRIESLPPLILHATGLYPDASLAKSTGYMFLQELGTLLPYENRIRFDQHLLLPSSQHSKPLQNLMAKLMDMRDSHNFQDSMAGLRHDWKDLPVYCIDGADAHEIDDGISLEPAGKNQHWVHVHIANPTAFFDRDHPLAKMARHMGETIYMPERTYMMLPRWATQRHFSLAPNRPCLTFSAKLDADGKTLEQKITPGIIRNVISLTPSEIETLIGDDSLEAKHPMQTFSVGGTPPPPRARKSQVPDMQSFHVAQLNTLNELAGRRAGIRKAAGGLFFDSHRVEVNVWQNYKHTGLAWDHPHRRGSRTVEGDPIIQLKTRALSNWFAPSANAVDVLVREFMLLACEISASWCAERDIPIIYRGTTSTPEKRVERERFMKEEIEPNTAADGTYPMWLGVQYLQTIGFTALRTEPIKHGFLGMEHYSKATSPLRRYGDMILHWQIEAALRHEASTGQSLAVSKRGSGGQRGLQLPFSRAALQNIMVGLQPRESIVSRSQAYTETFWIAMLLFRKHHFNEDGGLAGFPTREVAVEDPGQKGETRMATVPIFKAFVANRPDPHGGAPLVSCLLVEFNVTASMIPSVLPGMEVKLGDLWEVRMEKVDVFHKLVIVRAVSLVKREAM